MATETGPGAPDPPPKSRLDAHKAQMILESIIPYHVNRLSHRMNRLLDTELRTQGLSISNWRIMAVLDYCPATVTELARYAMIEQSTLSRMLQRLEAEGHVVSRTSAADRRVRTISLTDKGRAKYDTLREITMKHVGRVVDGFSPQERAQLMNFLIRMRENVGSLSPDATDD